MCCIMNSEHVQAVILPYFSICPSQYECHFEFPALGRTLSEAEDWERSRKKLEEWCSSWPAQK